MPERAHEYLIPYNITGFSSKDALFEYVSNPEYIIDPVNYPGVCFGFNI